MSGALHPKVLQQKHSRGRLRSDAKQGPTYGGTNLHTRCCHYECSGGIFSEHWIDGRRCGPLRRRHSGKGRAVPERCPSISISSLQLARCRHGLARVKTRSDASGITPCGSQRIRNLVPIVPPRRWPALANQNSRGMRRQGRYLDRSSVSSASEPVRSRSPSRTRGRTASNAIYSGK